MTTVLADPVSRAAFAASGPTLLDALEPHREHFVRLRHEIHARPETSYEEHHTSARVARELESYGLEVHRGIARTGVVGVLRNGPGSRSIGLRADIDALDIVEDNEVAYRSIIPGKMHACGHDGHTAMLLLAARYLSQTRQFNGTVVFIFQPAEEGGAGGREMVREGLFERFPVESVFGMHNIPGIPAGTFAVMPGPMMASADLIEFVLSGPGGHAALPHVTVDPILAGSALVQSLQSLISRSLDPLAPGVVSITQFHGGDTTNVIPSKVTLRGTVRAYASSTQALIEAGARRVARGIAETYGVDVNVNYSHGYPATINTPREAQFAREALTDLVGPDRVLTQLKPLMTAEDFSFMLQARPGAYLWIGNGDSAWLHTPRYNFNDDILTIGAAGWISLAEAALN